MPEEFPADEFDAAATQRGPAGAHRARSSRVTPWITGAVVLVLAAGAAYGASVLMWQASGGTGLPPVGEQTAATITQTVVDTPTTDPATESASAIPSETPTPTETAEPVRYDTAVVVLNGAGIGGLAGRNTDELTAAGFTAATAGNISSNLPSANVVRYGDPILQTTAEEVAAVLGIDTVERGVTPEGDISVILVTDPDA